MKSVHPGVNVSLDSVFNANDDEHPHKATIADNPRPSEIIQAVFVTTRLITAPNINQRYSALSVPTSSPRLRSSGYRNNALPASVRIFYLETPKQYYGFIVG